jgi:hypothetical protein
MRTFQSSTTNILNEFNIKNDIWINVISYAASYDYKSLLLTCYPLYLLINEYDGFKFCRLFFTNKYWKLSTLPSTEFLYSNHAENIFIRYRRAIISFQSRKLKKLLMPDNFLQILDERTCRGLFRYFFYEITKIKLWCRWFQQDIMYIEQYIYMKPPWHTSKPCKATAMKLVELCADSFAFGVYGGKLMRTIFHSKTGGGEMIDDKFPVDTIVKLLRADTPFYVISLKKYNSILALAVLRYTLDFPWIDQIPTELITTDMYLTRIIAYPNDYSIIPDYLKKEKSVILEAIRSIMHWCQITQLTHFGVEWLHDRDVLIAHVKRNFGIILHVPVDQQKSDKELEEIFLDGYCSFGHPLVPATVLKLLYKLSRRNGYDSPLLYPLLTPEKYQSSIGLYFVKRIKLTKKCCNLY